MTKASDFRGFFHMAFNVTVNVEPWLDWLSSENPKFFHRPEIPRPRSYLSRYRKL